MEETKREASKRFSKLQEARRRLHEKYGRPSSSARSTTKRHKSHNGMELNYRDDMTLKECREKHSPEEVSPEEHSPVGAAAR